jgi:hypothetical protein
MIAHSNSLTGLPFEGSQTTKHFRISAVVRSLAKSVDMFATSDETQRGKGRAAYTRVSRTIVEPRPTLVGKVCIKEIKDKDVDFRAGRLLPSPVTQTVVDLSTLFEGMATLGQQ